MDLEIVPVMEIDAEVNLQDHKRMRMMRTYRNWITKKRDGISLVSQIEDAWVEYTMARDIYLGFGNLGIN